MSESFRLLTQAEIEVLRFLARHGAYARPVTLPALLRQSVPTLWRMELVEVWFRAVPHDQPQPIGAYYGLSLAGWRRVQPFLTSRRL
jgi:hypothetical protein